MLGIFYILLFYLVGSIVSSLTGNIVCGSVIGMVLLFAALYFKIIERQNVSGASKFLLDNMAAFVRSARRRTFRLIFSYSSASLGHNNLGSSQHSYRSGRRRMDSAKNREETMMREIICSDIFILTLCVGVYTAAMRLFRKTKLQILASGSCHHSSHDTASQSTGNTI